MWHASSGKRFARISSPLLRMGESMKITIDSELIELLTYRGVLAAMAVGVLGDGQWTTAQLAQAVSANSSLMLEGMQELSAAAPAMVGKQSKTKWPVGSGVASTERVQILDDAAARRQDFLDDLKNSYEWANKGLPFSMNASDGRAVAKWLKQNKSWDRSDWKKAIYHRYMSEGISKTAPIYLWLGRLIEYCEAPLDRYGKVMMNGIGGKLGQAVGVEQGNRAARKQAVAAARRRS